MIYDINIIEEQILKAAFDNRYTPLKCERLFQKLCVQKPMLFVTVDYNRLARCSYNRHDKEVSEVFNNVGRLSYNPNIKTIKLQRCNYPKQQAFYGAIGLDNEASTMMSTAIMEVCFEYIKRDDKDTHYMTLSRWQITRPLSVFVLPYSDLSMSNNFEFKKAKENFDPMIAKVAKDLNVSVNYVRTYLKFISHIFCIRENKTNYYKISSAYVNYILNYAASMNKRVDGVIYPSANTDGAGMNIVLNPDLIDNKIIYADMAIMYKAQRDPNNLKHFDFTDASNEVHIGQDGKFCFSHIW